MTSARLALRRIAALLLALLALALPAQADEAVWRALRMGGHAVLIRHAIAPGGGDPPGFTLGDCATQRNLSQEGREQARRIGAAIRAAGVRVDRVLSSRWCRAQETARLLGLGGVESLPALDSFFSDRSAGPARLAGMREALAGIGDRTVVMVTHQVNVTGLTGVFPESGEMVVVRPRRDGRGIEVVGRLRK